MPTEASSCWQAPDKGGSTFDDYSLLEQEIIELAYRHQGQVRRAELVEYVAPRNGVADSTVRRYLRQMVKSGTLVVHSGDMYSIKRGCGLTVGALDLFFTDDAVQRPSRPEADIFGVTAHATQRALPAAGCGAWMPRAKDVCGLTRGHAGPHRRR